MKQARKILRRPATSEINSRFEPCSDSITSMMYGHEKKKEKQRISQSDYIHVSSLVRGECLRMYQLGLKHKIEAWEKPRLADRLLWAIGKAVEAYIRESLISLYGMENCLGKWHCQCGDTHHQGYGIPGKSCKKCGSLVSNYSEYHVTDDEIMLSGSPDILIRTRDNSHTAIEIKSIKVVPAGGIRNSTPEFNSLTSPVRSHVLQALLYRALLQRKGIKVTDEIMVFYGAKDYVMKLPYKVFTIDATESHNERPITQFGEMMAEHTNYLHNPKRSNLTDRLSRCTGPTCSQAKSCPAATHCF